MFERHASLLNLITLFNTLTEWGTKKDLRFNTMAPFDQEEALILDPKLIQALAFPELPETAKASLFQSVSPDQAALLMREADVLSRTAEEFKAQIVSLGNLEGTNRNKYMMDSQENFDRAKASAHTFSVAMTRMKGKRNAVALLVGQSDLLTADPNIAADWMRLKTQLKTLSEWGDTHFIQYDKAFTVIERNHALFPVSKFSQTFLLPLASEKPPVVRTPTQTGTGTGTGTGRTAGRVSYNAAYDMIRDQNRSGKLSVTLRTLPLIQGLTTRQLNSIANLNESYDKDEVISFGLRYVHDKN